MCLRVARASAIVLLIVASSGATLRVGPNQRYKKPSAAFAAAKEGDVIEIDTTGVYGGDVATIRTGRLTIRGVGQGRAKLPANGRHAGGKAIWVIPAGDVVIENVEFSGARVPDRNGAGIRAEGKNLTLRNCRFYDCEDGILGGAGEIVIEGCEFAHCGPVPQPATHSLYIGERCAKLVFRFNYSTDVIEGHLLKSRAKENWIMYNRITDESGTGSAVIDLPDGGLAVIVGNILHKGPRAQNNRVIAYGMEGIKHERNGLYVVNNTMLYNYRRASWFVRVENAPAGFAPVIRNNLCIGKIPLTNSPNAVAAGNVLVNTPEEARVVDAGKFDFHLKPGSPCIATAVDPGNVGDFDLTPRFQYVHPCKGEPRSDKPKLDVGAFHHGN